MPKELKPIEVENEEAGSEAEAEAAAPPKEPQVPPGRAGVEDIVARRHQQLIEEGKIDVEPETADAEAEEGAESDQADAAPDGEEEVTEAAEEAAEGETEEAGAPEADADSIKVMVDGVERTISGAMMLPVTINGQTEMKPAREVLSGFQQASASQEAMRAAAQMRTEAQDILNKTTQLQTAAAATRTAPAGQPAPAKATSPALTEEKLAELADKIQTGDKDDGIAAIKELAALMASAPAAAIDPNQIATIARTTAQATSIDARIQSDQATALNNFANKYPEIAKDAALHSIAGQRADEIRREELKALGYDAATVDAAPPQQLRRTYGVESVRGRVRTQDELLLAAGEKTVETLRDAAKGLGMRNAENGGEDPAQKVSNAERKSKLKPAVKGAGVKSGMGKQPAKTPAQTRSEAINEQRRARGQEPAVTP